MTQLLQFGAAGKEQGRDVIAFRASSQGEQLWYFQCKRCRRITASKLIEEIAKYNALYVTEPNTKAFGIVFVTNAIISVRVRDRVRDFCTKYSYSCEFWAGTELDLRALANALDNLIIGRAYLLRARKSDMRDCSELNRHLRCAMDGLKQVGRQDYLPAGLLLRSRFIA